MIRSHQRPTVARLMAARFTAPRFTAPRFTAPRFTAPRFTASPITAPQFRVFAIPVGACLVLALSGCGLLPEVSSPAPVITTPQAALAGEWILTRTVTVSDDSADPTKAVGAISTRLVLIKQETCDTAICPGTVASGITTDGRTTTVLTQTDGGLSWNFQGTLNCLNAATGDVQVPDAFAFDSTTTLTVVESIEVDGTLSASLLTGTTIVNDSLSLEASNRGCHRTPAQSHVEYSLSAVRAPLSSSTESPGSTESPSPTASPKPAP